MRAKALLYRLDGEDETGKRLREILRAQSVLALDVSEDRLGERVGKLASTNAAPTDAPAPERIPETPLLLLCALGDRQLDRLLAALRREGVAMPYKAVLTEHNREWTFARLAEEVAREHEALQKREENRPGNEEVGK